MNNDKLELFIDNDNQKLISIYEAIDNHKSWCLQAGAGSGKTYSLVESIKYIVRNYGLSLKYNNQRIACITYTNVAANEIKIRIGNNDIVSVSTIHEFVWKIIEKYQIQLKKYVIQDIEQVKIKLKNDIGILKASEDLTKDDINSIIENESKFWKHQHDDAPKFKIFLNSIVVGKKIKSVIRVKNIIKKTIKLNQLEALTENDYPKKVVYNPRYNSNNLAKFRINHDDILMYFKNMIEDYERFRKIICDEYPYILVDEYQDTNKNVIEGIEKLIVYANSNRINFCTGYYGDEMQAIYKENNDDMINLNPLLYNIIQSKYNWRSTKSIIELANRIRKDYLQQDSIYKDNYGEKVSFFEENFDNAKQLEFFRNKWNVSKDNPLHVFVLKNKTVAKYNEFLSVFTYFESMVPNNELRNYVLSNDKFRLGEVAVTLINLTEFVLKIINDDKSVMLNSFISKEVAKKLSYNTIKYINQKILDIRKEILNKNQTLEQVLNIVFDYSDDSMKVWKSIIEEVALVNLEELNLNCIDSVDNLKRYLSYKFSDKDLENVYSVLKVGMQEFYNWFNYINRNYGRKNIIYHTFHGTKGLEFDNVVIIINDTFYSKKFFKTIYSEDDAQSEVFRNLFYVAVTRARRNLAIISNQLDEERKKIKEEFGDFLDFY